MGGPGSHGDGPRAPLTLYIELKTLVLQTTSSLIAVSYNTIGTDSTVGLRLHADINYVGVIRQHFDNFCFLPRYRLMVYEWWYPIN